MAAQRRLPKSVAFKFGDFDFMTNNHVAAITNKEGVSSDFHSIMDFMASGPLSYALTASPQLNQVAISQAWENAEVIDSVQGQSGKIVLHLGQDTYDITESVVNSVLHLPVSVNFENVPSDDNVRTMLSELGYNGPLDNMSQLNRSFLRKEWSFFFDQIAKCFTGKCSSFQQITSVTSHIAYSLLYDRVINIGSIILSQMCIKLGSRDQNRKMVYYHRFMQLFINHFIPDVEARFGREYCVSSYVQQKRIFSDITKKDNEKNLDDIPAMHYPHHVQVFLTTHLPTIYNSSFFCGEMTQESHLVENPPVSTLVAQNLVSETSQEPIFDPQPVVSSKPTSGVSQKTSVVKKRRFVVSSSSSSEDDDNISLAERAELKAAIQLSKLGQRDETPSHSQAAVSQKAVVLKKGKQLLDTVSQKTVSIEKGSHPKINSVSTPLESSQDKSVAHYTRRTRRKIHLSPTHTESSPTNIMQVSTNDAISKSAVDKRNLDIDSSWETTLTYRLAMQVISIKVKLSKPVLDFLVERVPKLSFPEEYGLLHQRLDLMKMHFYVSVRRQLVKKFGLSKHVALQSLHTYLFHEDYIVEDAQAQGEHKEVVASGMQSTEDTIAPVVSSRTDQITVTATQEPSSQRLDDSGAVIADAERSSVMTGIASEKPYDMRGMTMIDFHEDQTNFVQSESIHLEGVSQQTTLEDGDIQVLVSNEVLLKASVSSINPESGILEPVVSDRTEDVCMGSETIAAHSVEKTSSPLPYEEPSLHVSSGIKTSFKPYFSVGHESTYPNLSDTLKKMDLDPQIERLAPDQAKGEVERVLTLDSQSENEGMDDQLHSEGEKIRKPPSFDFWDQVFPESWSDNLGMDAGTYSFIKMYERHDLAKHNAKPEVKAQKQKERLAGIINRRGERLRQSLTPHVPEDIPNDPSIPLYVLPISARIETSTVPDHSQEESVFEDVSTQNTSEGQDDHTSAPDQKDDNQLLLLEYHTTSAEPATQATSSVRIDDRIPSASEPEDTTNTSDIEVNSDILKNIQSSQKDIQSRLQRLEDNQVTIMENQEVLMNLMCSVTEALGIHVADVKKGEISVKRSMGNPRGDKQTKRDTAGTSGKGKSKEGGG